MTPASSSSALPAQRHRGTAPAAAPASSAPPPSITRLLDLPDHLQSTIASFLPGTAAIQMGAASKACHALYPLQVKALVLRQWALAEGELPTNEVRWKLSVMSHAVTLARLLYQMDNLESIAIENKKGKGVWMDHCLGHALLLLPPRARLSEICFPPRTHDSSAYEFRLYEAPPTNEPHSLLLAIGDSKIPALIKILDAGNFLRSILEK